MRLASSRRPVRPSAILATMIAAATVSTAVGTDGVFMGGSTQDVYSGINYLVPGGAQYWGTGQIPGGVDASLDASMVELGQDTAIQLQRHTVLGNITLGDAALTPLGTGNYIGIGHGNGQDRLTLDVSAGSPTFILDSGIAAQRSNSGTISTRGLIINPNQIRAQILGNEGFTVTASGPAGGALTLVGGAPNLFSGQVTINSGALLRLGKNQALGAMGAGNETIVLSGGTLDLGGQTAGLEEIQIAGSGIGGIGALVNLGGDNLNAFRKVILTGDATVGGSGRFDLRSLQSGVGETLDLAGHTLTKVGSNQVSIVSIPITTGNIVVNEGTFSIEAATSFNAASTMTVNRDATFGIWNNTSGAQTASLTVNAGGIVAEMGSGSTTSTLSTPIAFAGDGTLRVAGTNTRLNLNGGISGNGTVTVSTTAANTRVVLSGTNTHSGSIYVQAANSGVLQLNNGTTLASSNIYLQEGATLDVSGFTSGYNVALGQRIIGGRTTAANDIVGTLNLAEGSYLNAGGNHQNKTLTVSGGLKLLGSSVLELAPGADSIVVGGTNTFTATDLNLVRPQVPAGSTSITAGTHTLLTGGAVPTATAANFDVLGSAFDYRQTFTFGIAGNSLQVTVAGSAASATYTGTALSPNWEVNSFDSWTVGGSQDVFKQLDQVTFDDNASNTAVNLVGSLNPGSVVVNSSTKNYTFGGTGTITGGGGLTKSGSSTLTISGEHDFGGAVTINGGTLSVASIKRAGLASGLGSGATLNLGGGALSYTGGTDTTDRAVVLSGNGSAIGITNAGTDLTLTGVISGGGNWSKTGPGKIKLTGNNTYTGQFTIAAGTVIAELSTVFGATGAGNETIILPGATLDIGGRAAANAVVLGTEILQVSGSGVGGLGAIVNNGLNTQTSAVSKLVLTGPTTLGGLNRWDIRSNSATLDAGNHKITKVGTNDIAIIDVTTSNIGAIDVNEGLLRFEASTVINGDASLPITVNANSVLDFYGNNLTQTKRIVLNGGELRTSGGAAATTVFGAGQDFVLSANSIINVGGGNGTPGTGRTDTHLKIDAKVTGTGDITKQGVSSLRLSNGNNDWAGNLRVIQGAVDLYDGSEVIPDTAKLIVGQVGTINLSASTVAPGAATPRLETVAAIETPTEYDHGAQILVNTANVNSTLKVLTAGTSNYAGRLTRSTGSITLEMAGTGEQILSGNQDNGGAGATVTSGTLTFAKTSSMAVHAVGAALTINGGTLKLGGTGGDQIYRDVAVTLDGGTFDLNGRSEGFAALNGVVGTGTVTNNGAAASTLFVGDNDSAAGNFGGQLTAGTGALNFVKVGNATQTLSGNATYTSAAPIQVRGGTLAVDVANLANATNLLNSASSLVVDSATFSFIGQAALTSSQQLVGTSFQGNSTINVNNNGGTAALALGPITRSGTVNFTTTGAGTSFVTTSSGAASSVLTIGGVAFAAYQGNDWAAKDASNVAVTNFTSVGSYAIDTWAPGSHTTVTSSSAQTDATTDTLRFNNAGAFTVTLNGANTLTSGGILVGSGVGNNVSTLAGTGTLTSAANELVILQNNTNGLTVTARFVDQGNTPLNVTKSGGGALNFNANQGFTGTLRVLGGTVTQNGRERLSSQVDLVLGNGGVYTLNDNVQTFASVSSNDYNGIAQALRNGTINLGSGQLIVGGDNTSTTLRSKLSGSSAGLGTLVKTGTGTLTLGGTDDNNSMNLAVRQGTVILDKLSTGTARLANISNIVTGATVRIAGQSGDQIYGGGRGFGVTISGGTLDLNGRSETTGSLYGNGTVTNTLANTLSTLSLGETSNAGYFTGTITESAGAVTALNKTSTSLLVLSGNSTFTGAVTVTAGRLAVPTIANAGVASPLGAGEGPVLLNGGTLSYTGSAAASTNLNFDTRSNASAIEVLDSAANLTLTGYLVGGDFRLNKRGAGTLTIRPEYTGQWNGTNAYLVAQGGSLVLDHASILGNNRSDLGNTALFNSNLGLGFEGGSITVKSKPGSQATTQSFARSSLASGWTTLTGDSSPGTGALTVTLGTIALGNAGSSLNIVKPANGNIQYVNNNVNGITSPRVTFGGTTWAVGQGTGTGNASVSGYTAFSTDNYATATNHVNVTTDVAFAAPTSVATLRFNAALAGGALGLDGQALTLNNSTSNLGGILVTSAVGANNLRIENGTLLSSTTAGAEIVVHQMNTAGSLEIGAVIQDNTTPLALTKGGPGKLILSGLNTFTGAMSIGGGILEVATIAAKATEQPLGKGDITMQGGTLRYTGPSATTDKIFTLGSTGATIDVATAGTTLTLNATAWGVDAANHMGNLTKDGPGTLELTGTGATYTGFTYVNGGVLSLNPSVATATPVNPSGSGIVVNNGGTLRFQKGDVFGVHTTFNQPTVMVNAGGTVTNNGSYNNLSLLVLSGGTLTSTGGSNANYPSWGLRGQVTVNGDTMSTITGSGTNHGAFVYNTQFNVANGAAPIDLQVSTPLLDGRDGGGTARPVGFVKTGAGVMELKSGTTHGFTGFVETVEGTLLVNGALSGTSTVNVYSGATLAGAGTVGALQVEAGTVSPGANTGANAGVLNVGNTIFNGGTFSAEINGLVPGTEHDQLNVTGTLGLTAPVALNLTMNYTPLLSDTFILINNDGSDVISGSGYFTYNGIPLFDGAQFGDELLGEDFLFRIDYDGGMMGGDNDVVLTVVPEPGSALMLLGGLGAMAAMRRRRRSC